MIVIVYKFVGIRVCFVWFDGAGYLLCAMSGLAGLYVLWVGSMVVICMGSLG